LSILRTSGNIQTVWKVKASRMVFWAVTNHCDAVYAIYCFPQPKKEEKKHVDFHPAKRAIDLRGHAKVKALLGDWRNYCALSSVLEAYPGGFL
jgi:hypothetical protein